MSVTISGLNHNRRNPRFPEFPESVDLEVDDPRFVNWANGNAAALFALLGLGAGSKTEWSEGYVQGEAPLPDVRRAIIRARATFERRAPELARPESVEHGAPRALPDGSVELRPVRRYEMGLDAEGIGRRLDAFERAVDALADLGATHIAWA
jgi:hypothetical protein